MRIFFSPLDWGLGHASRCVPVISYLLEKNIEVVIGAEGTHALFLKEHFPHLEFVNFPGYRVNYSKNIPAGLRVLLQIPKINSAIKEEHKLLHELAAKKKIDAVISDNRYGLWNKKIPSVIISHQLNIQASAGNSLLSKTVQKHIKHFDACWVPDYEGPANLSGALSHPIPTGINASYIGPLSRFSTTPQPPKGSLNKAAQSPFRGLGQKYDLLVILSGPEPQRSKLEELIIRQLKELPSVKTLIIQGLPGNKPIENNLPNVKLVPHLPDKEFQEAVNCSEVILSRPGYSTIMDLHAIGYTKAIFIPTPGQTEQEYLGKLMEKKRLGVSFPQKHFSIKEALEKAFLLSPAEAMSNNHIYKKAIDAWIANMP